MLRSKRRKALKNGQVGGRASEKVLKLKSFSHMYVIVSKISTFNTDLRIIKSTQANSSGNVFRSILSVMRFIIVNLNFIESILSSFLTNVPERNKTVFSCVCHQLIFHLLTRYKWKGMWKLKRDHLDGWVSGKGNKKKFKIY